MAAPLHVLWFRALLRIDNGRSALPPGLWVDRAIPLYQRARRARNAGRSGTDHRTCRVACPRRPPRRGTDACVRALAGPRVPDDAAADERHGPRVARTAGAPVHAGFAGPAP